jgi:putative membrane protein
MQAFWYPFLGGYMNHLNAGDWYFGWGWFLWLGFIIIMFSSFGNWGYTYCVHRKMGGPFQKEAIDILNERYARGDVTRVQYLELKSDIAKA